MRSSAARLALLVVALTVSGCSTGASTTQLAAGFEIGSFSPACIVVEEAEGPESGFTRPTCEMPNIQYLTTVDPAAAEATLLAVLNG